MWNRETHTDGEKMSRCHCFEERLKNGLVNVYHLTQELYF